MLTAAIFSRLLCLISFVALATAATPALDTLRPGDDGDGFCAAAPPPPSGADSGGPLCGAADHPDEVPVLENLGVMRDPKVRPVNDSSYFTHHIIRTVQRLAPTSQSQELALWMLVEFLKAAPLFMGLGCLTTIFVALRQKWSDIASSEASVKIRWTKPAAC